MSTFDEVYEKAQGVLTVAATVIPLVVPGSVAAIKVAEAAEAAVGLLRFGRSITSNRLPELAAQFDAIKAEMDAVVESGSADAPMSIFKEVDAGIHRAAARIRTALGQHV